MTPAQAGQAWLDALPDATIGIDAQGNLEWANRAATELFGYPLEEYSGRFVMDLVHPDDLEFALLCLGSIQTKPVGTLIEVRVGTSWGWKLVELVGANRLGDPGIDCLVMTMRDLTQRRRWEVGHNDDTVFRSVVQSAASVLMLVGFDGTILAVSAAVTRLLGLDPEPLEGSALLDLVNADDRSAVERAFAACQSPDSTGERIVTVEAGLRHADGQPVPFELTMVDKSDDPTVPGVVVSAHDITKLRDYQRALADLARTDPLTLLPNRAEADDRLGGLLERRVAVAVAFVDLDGFKCVNDRFGHHFGDQVLRMVAGRLLSTVRPCDLVARYGGDEFVVIAHDLSETARLGQWLADSLAEPLRVGERNVLVRASVGVTCTRSGDTVADVLIRADRAMYDSKASRTTAGVAAGR